MRLDEALAIAEKLEDNGICAMVYKYDSVPGEDDVFAHMDEYSEVERMQLTVTSYGVHILTDYVTGDIIIAITEAS